MTVEIEAKLKVDSTEEIEGRLTRLDAEFLQEQLQKDYYFDNADANLIKTDRCIRLRRQITKKQEKIFLTYKGPKEKDKFKKRQVEFFCKFKVSFIVCGYRHNCTGAVAN